LAVRKNLSLTEQAPQQAAPPQTPQPEGTKTMHEDDYPIQFGALFAAMIGGVTIMSAATIAAVELLKMIVLAN
jgi:hypothetical protein